MADVMLEEEPGEILATSDALSEGFEQEQELGSPVVGDSTFEHTRVDLKAFSYVKTEKDTLILSSLRTDVGKCVIFVIKSLRSVLNNMTWAGVARWLLGSI